MLANKDYISISSGKLIRACGLDVSSGNLINDKIVISLIYTEMNKTTKSIIHDGFPRTVNQGLEFLKLGEKIDCVIYFNLSYEHLCKRVSNRLVCSNPLCQATFNRENEVAENGQYYCHYCNSLLTVRPDDHPKAIKKRYDIFEQNLNGIIHFCEIYDIPFDDV